MTPPIVVLIEFDVHPHAVEAFAEALRIGAAQRATFEGCLRVEALRSTADPTLFTMLEVYRTQADIDHYYASEAQSVWMASIRSFVRELRSADQRLVYAYQAAEG